MFYFNSWHLFDQVVNMIGATLVVFREARKFMYFFLTVIKFYVDENHYANFAVLMKQMATFFEIVGDLPRSRQYCYNALQWAIVMNDITVK